MPNTRVIDGATEQTLGADSPVSSLYSFVAWASYPSATFSAASIIKGRMIMIRITVRSLLTLSLSSVLFVIAHAATDVEWKTQIQMKLPASASTLSYSADGSLIAVGHADGRVTIWNIKSGELVRLLDAHSKEVNSVQFILGDTRLLTIGDDQRALLWSTSDWSVSGTIEGVAFSGGASPDGHWLAAQDPKQAIWVWDLSTLKAAKQLTEPGKGGTKNMTFTADGRYVATAYNTPLLINVETKQSVSFVVSGDKKTEVKIQQEGNRATISLGSMKDDDAPTHRVMPSQSGPLVALGRAWYGQPAFVDVWDLSSMKRIGRFKSKDGGTLTSFSFDNSLLAVDGSEKVTIWRIASGKQVTAVKSNGTMEFSPKVMELAATDGANLIIYVPKE